MSTTTLRIVVDEPVEGSPLIITLGSELPEFNNKQIVIPVGQTMGLITVPTPTGSGSVRILGYSGGNIAKLNAEQSIEYEDGVATVGPRMIRIRVAMDKPVQTEKMVIELESDLEEADRKRVEIPVGEQSGVVDVALPSTRGTVGMLGYTGGGWVNPDLSDEIEIGGAPAPLGFGVVVWTEEESYNDDGQIESRTVTVRNAANTGSVTFSYDLPTFPIPEGTWFEGGNGSENIVDGVLGNVWQCSQAIQPDLYRQTRRVEQFAVDTDNRLAVVCLPVSADSCVFVYRSRGAASWWYKQVETVSEDRIPSWRLAQRGNYCGNVWNQEPLQPSDSWYFDADIFYETTLNTDAAESVSEWEITKCYLVTPTGVSEIEPPAQLVAALQQYEPESYGVAPGAAGTYLPTGSRENLQPPEPNKYNWVGSGNNIPYSYYYFQDFPSEREHPFCSFSWGEGPEGADYGIPNDFDHVAYFSEPVMVNRLVSSPQAVPSFSDLYSAVPLVTFYGIGNLAGDDHTVAGSASFQTPGVFNFLAAITPAILDGYSDIQDYRDAMDESNSQYGYVAENYLVELLLPSTFYAPCVLSGSCPVDSSDGINGADPADSYVRFDATSTTPTDIYTPLTVPDDFTAGDVTIDLVGLSGGERLIYSWDWGQPLHCRVQLFALGFTEEDLTPEAPAP